MGEMRRRDGLSVVKPLKTFNLRGSVIVGQRG